MPKLLSSAVFTAIEQEIPNNLALLAGLRGHIVFHIDGKSTSGEWTLDLSTDPPSVYEGRPAGDVPASSEVTAEDKTFVSILTGGLDPIKAYLTGAIQASGGVMLLLQLSKILKVVSVKYRELFTECTRSLEEMSGSDSDLEEKPKKESKRKPSSDDDEVKKPKKDAKRKRAQRESSESSGVDDPEPVKKVKKGGAATSGNRVKNDQGEEMIELGNMRYISKHTFKGTTYVDIREYYVDRSSGAMKPGKKGISMSLQQYANLKDALPEIDKMLK